MNTKSAVILAASLGVSILALAGPSGQSSVSMPVTELKYGPTGVSDGVHGELNAAAAYGDLAHGAHGTFIKMPAGFVSPVHTHTEDYWGVVISGVAANGVPGSKDIPLPVGSYWPPIRRTDFYQQRPRSPRGRREPTSLCADRRWPHIPRGADAARDRVHPNARQFLHGVSRRDRMAVCAAPRWTSGVLEGPR